MWPFKRKQTNSDKSTELKLCKDCKWFIKDLIFSEKHQCGNVNSQDVDIVTGEKLYYYASAFRNAGVTSNKCGYKAKYFEPKE